MYSGVLEQELMYLAKERMVHIGAVHLFVSCRHGCQHACFFKPHQLRADGVGGFAEFGFQVAQPGGGVAVEEELEQQPQTGFRCNECLKQNV